MKLDPRLIDLAIKEGPKVIELLKSAFRREHPDAHVPTDEEVIAAYVHAIETSLDRDEQLLAEEPPDGAA